MLGFSTVPEGLQHWAKHKADHPAFIFRSPEGDRNVQTFEQIYRHGGRYAAVLRAGGAARGHLVANTLPNCPERVVCEAAILMTGAASVNAMCQLADGSDLLRTLRVSRAMAVLVDPDVTHSLWHVLKNYVTRDDDDSAVSEELPHLRRVYFVRRLPQNEDDFLCKMDLLSDWFMADDVKPDDVCSVFTTSGTSGFSKLVAQTHLGVTQAAVCYSSLNECVSGEGTEFAMAPLGWAGGYACTTLLSGSVRVLWDTRNGLPTDGVDFMLKCFQEEKVNFASVPPPYLDLLLERVKQMKKKEGGASPDPNNPDTAWRILDRITSGGQPITPSHVQTACLLARSVLIIYGQTECFYISSMNVTDPNSYRDFDCGILFNDAQVKIVDGADGVTPLPAGKVGQILFKKPAMMKEYINDPDASAAAITDDGFFRTGDIGFVDERGHLIVGGRGSDAIMRGPYIFYPTWLEERIRACPAVSDVMIVGVPHPALNEEICACVKLKSDQMTVQQVRDFVEKDIVTSDDDPLSPRPRHYLTFDSFPVTPTGKPHRHGVKQQAAARLRPMTK